ncbi:MAG: VOC family protein, partial [Candidatus Acidiferrum sp.]
HVAYQDLSKAIVWLNKAFGFHEHYRYGEPVSGAQVHLGNAWMMLEQGRAGRTSPAALGSWTQSLTIFIDDVEAHFRRARQEGAKILEEPHETIYGEFQYAAEDLEGHHWLFSRHAKNLSPNEWGATIHEAASRLVELRRPRFCYVEIPARDVHKSAEFYEKVFGWHIRHRESLRPSFNDATGNMSGAWVTGREAFAQPGILPFIWVDDIRASAARVTANGGEMLETPHPDSPGGTSWIATFRDPSGNVLGLYQEAVA